MPIAKIKDKIDRLKTARVEPPPPAIDERDALIEKLEGELVEARDGAAELSKQVDELRFQNDTLETSYAKQLVDARERQTAAEETLAALQAELDEVGKGEDILAQLKAAQAELEVVTGERDRLRDRIREPASRKPMEGVLEHTDAAAEIEAYSIDELLEDAIWAQDQARQEKQRAREAKAAASAEVPSEDMVAPDLVFPGKAAESSG